MQLVDNKTIRLIICFFLILSVVSCEKPLSDYKPEYQNRLVIWSKLNPDSTINVNISLTTAINQEIEYDTLFKNTLPVVELWKNEVYYSHLKYKENFIFHLPNQTPEIGTDYTVKVSYKDYPSVSASTSIPEPVKIIDAEIEKGNFVLSRVNRLDTFSLKCSFTIKDPLETKNYYYVYLSGPSDPPFSEDIRHKKYPVFTDETFKGQKKTINLYTRECCEEKYTIILRTLSEEYYHYYIGRLNYSSPGGDILSGLFPVEPFPMYTNVKNGRGVFAGYSQDTIRINGIE